MSYAATVLYEDKMPRGAGGIFPPHDFVLAMVADKVGDDVVTLRKRFDPHPCNGINKLVDKVANTKLIAAQGILCALVDRDRVAEHLGLPRRATEASVIKKLKAKSDAPERLHVHFLEPNLEGVMRHIEACSPKHPAPAAKDHDARDLYFKRASFSLPERVRDCVRGKQPSLAALADRLADLCRDASASG